MSADGKNREAANREELDRGAGPGSGGVLS